MGCNTRMVKALNIWGLDSVLGMNLQGLDQGGPVYVFNIYGPYLNRIPFWENLFNLEMFGGDLVIIGGDLNFSLRQVEVWGPFAYPYILSEYFS